MAKQTTSNKESHPSFGLLAISRVQGTRRLFGSSLLHGSSVTLSISRSTRSASWTGSEDYYPTQEVIEVAMSETQFARAITSMNVGFGTPCTISREAGQLIPGPPDPKCPVDSHANAAKEATDAYVQRLSDVVDGLSVLMSESVRPTLKQVKEIHTTLRSLVEQFKTSQEFHDEQFRRRMESAINDAKTEVDAHVANVVSRIGIASIENSLPSLVVGGVKRITQAEPAVSQGEKFGCLAVANP